MEDKRELVLGFEENRGYVQGAQEFTIEELVKLKTFLEGSIVVAEHIKDNDDGQ